MMKTRITQIQQRCIQQNLDYTWFYDNIDYSMITHTHKNI
jgi:hypothetical protein